MTRDEKADRDGPGGKLLIFPARALLGTTPRPEGPRGAILLFTGVRYERHPEPAHPVAALGGELSPAPAGAGRGGPRRRA